MRHLEEALERIRSSADIERSESIVVLSNLPDDYLRVTSGVGASKLSRLRSAPASSILTKTGQGAKGEGAGQELL